LHATRRRAQPVYLQTPIASIWPGFQVEIERADRRPERHRDRSHLNGLALFGSADCETCTANAPPDAPTPSPPP